MLLGALDAYVVVSVMRDIIVSVSIPINQLQRVTPIITGYLLGYIAAMPLLGRASDRFGRKLLLQASLGAFAIGSVITGLASDLSVLVVGRTIQGVAAGALLPVTLALGADLWAQRNRAGVLGGIGAAQELGSVLGPLYGIFIVFVFHDWRYIFWINVPLSVIAMAMIQASLPARDRSANPEKIDLVGGVLLAVTLSLAVIGLYNPHPNAQQVLPSYGWPLVIGAGVAAVAFGVWEGSARTKLIVPTGVHFRPLLAAMGASLAAGAALMVTLVNVELFAQAVLGEQQDQAAITLLRFLIALPIGAVVGGWVATKLGDRTITFAGLLIAAGGYWLISKWPVDLLSYRHDVFGLFALPALDTDLLLAGLGLGLVIGPLSSASLRVVPSAQHGIASALVVVARNIGMVMGLAALNAYGFYRLNQIIAGLTASIPRNAGLTVRIGIQVHLYRQAYAEMYSGIFAITAIACVAGALLGLLLGSRHERAQEPVAESGIELTTPRGK